MAALDPGGPEVALRRPAGRRGRVRGSVVLAVVLFGLIAWYGWREGASAVQGLRPLEAAGAFLATAAATLVSARRWQGLTELLTGEAHVPGRVYYRSLMAGRALGFLLPQGVGDLGVRAVVQRATASGSLLGPMAAVGLERALDATLVALLAPAALAGLLGRLQGAGLVWAFGLAFGLWLVLFVLLSRPVFRGLAGFLGWLAGRRPAGRLRRLRLGETAEAVRRLAERPGPLWTAGALTGLRYLLIAAQFALVARALGLGAVGFLETLAALPGAQAGLMLGLTPGGLGLLEGGFYAGLRAQAVPSDQTAAFVLGQRVLVTLFTLSLAALAWLLPVEGKGRGDG